MDNLHIYLLAGVQTRDSAFTTLTNRLLQSLKAKGIKADIEILYPYGDYSRKLWKQVLDLCIDINFINKYSGIGGKRVMQQLEGALQKGKTKFLLIGHSGGGVAAYRIARFLYYHFNIELDQLRVVQIGSPKIRVASRFQSQIAYIQAIDEQGKLKDPITKIGYWGGFQIGENENSKRGWNSQKYAPAVVQSIPLIGGHADYFRSRAPFIDKQEQSNLDYTFIAFEEWLHDWLSLTNRE